MNVKRALSRVHVPDEQGAEDRTWDVVRVAPEVADDDDLVDRTARSLILSWKPARQDSVGDGKPGKLHEASLRQAQHLQYSVISPPAIFRRTFGPRSSG